MLPNNPVLGFRRRPVAVAAGGGPVAFGWSNYSDNVTANGSVTSFTVGTTNAASSNGAISTNDLLIMAVVVSVNAGDPGSLTVPGGWTQVTNTLASQDGLYRYGVWYKLAGGGEGGTYSVSWTNASRGASWYLGKWTSVNTSTPVETSAAVSNGSYSANIGAPTVTPTASDDMLICFGMDFGGNGAVTAPSGMTARGSVGSSSSDRPGISAAELTLTTNSATGTKNFTIGGSTQSAGVSLAVKHA